MLVIVPNQLVMRHLHRLGRGWWVWDFRDRKASKEAKVAERWGGLGEEEELTAIIGLDEEETAMVGLGEENKKNEEEERR